MFGELNDLFFECMRLIIGAHRSASRVAVLVRLGVMPLEYMLIFEALLWVLKIAHGETDPLLTEELNRMKMDGDTLLSTCLYVHGCDFIDRLNSLVDKDIWYVHGER